MGNMCNGPADNSHTKDEIKSEKKQKKSKGIKDKKSQKKKKSKKSTKGAEVEDQAPGEQIVENGDLEAKKNSPIIEEEKDTYDESDINTMLPPEPTLSDALNDKSNLKILKEARTKAVEFWSWQEDKVWKEIKDKDGVVLHKTDAPGTQIFIKRSMTVEAPIQDCVDIIMSLDIQRQ